MTVEIKNMVCQRCIMRVQEDLTALGFGYNLVELGIVYLTQSLSPTERQLLDQRLRISGLELIRDENVALVELIKRSVVNLIQRPEDLPTIKLSKYLTEMLGYRYEYLSHVFSEVTHTTIQHFLVTARVEQVKELLQSKNWSIKEIAFKLHYSSKAHLSAQFKAITGQCPSKYYEHEKQINTIDA
jgi:AraC-like DNA-binding protein